MFLFEPNNYLSLQGIYVAHVLTDGPASSLLKKGDKILQVIVIIFYFVFVIFCSYTKVIKTLCYFKKQE